jgi:hypothetical protein
MDPARHFPVRSRRWRIIGPHECHGGTATYMRLQFFEYRAGEAFSALGFGHANRAV